ncbi:helix-turn-helix transcriptional regulator [Nocardia sp. NPDC051030]|uniref:helix-turn-helix domain-containing protein n=1 Tax=Nocardia sp. NPDC051030 TaxID=3155162 RepID=UPI003416DA51
MSDNELGLFLRIKREAVTPAEVGLPAGARRRTPGLRRSELATLAGVSVEYITRMEQGRDRHPSSAVLTALADALHMTSSERVHMHRLVKAEAPGFKCQGTVEPTRVVRPAVRAILEQLEPAPAFVVNRASEILAWTDAYRSLMGPTGLFDSSVPANFARYMFTDARARVTHPDWEHAADTVVATLKVGPFRADPVVSSLVDELTATVGEEFTDRVARIPGLPDVTGIERLDHPEVGPLRLAHETLELSADDDQRLIIQLPADEASAAALDRLIGRKPGSLRAVAG